MSNEMESKAANPLAIIRGYLDRDSVKKRLEETLGKRAGAFANSIINVVRNNKQLQNCIPDSIMSAAMIAATMNLPIDPTLQQAAIVPYGNSAQFQIMYRGVTQLCIRSGLYQTIHCTEVYAGELKFHNPITGEVLFNDPATFKMRLTRKPENVVGHYAYLKLLTGFEKADYMTTEEVMAHAEEYSKAYQYDLAKKKQTSAWSTNPTAMGNKTVLLRLLTKYGVMSIEMQDALVADHKGFEASQAEAEKSIEDEAGSEIIDADFDAMDAEEKDPETAAKAQEQIDKVTECQTNWMEDE